jgi:hypothetical protein
VVPLAQAYRPFVIDILGPQIYPDRRQFPGGPPERTFDLTGWTLPFQMGVAVDRVEEAFAAELEPITQAKFPEGRLDGTGAAYILDHGVLDTYRAVNRLLKAGAGAAWASEPFQSGGKTYPAGTILVSGKDLENTMTSLADEFHLQIEAGGEYSGGAIELAPLRLGLYKPWVANMDEGWTRWIFDTWEFPYTTLHDQDIRSGDFRKTCDVILVTNVSARRIVDGHREGSVPPEYAGGIGPEGLEALKRFVQEGGSLITLNSGCQLPLNHFGVPFRDVSRTYPTTDFFCPSAILKGEVDTTHPIGYGMGDTANLLVFNSPLFESVGNDGPGNTEGTNPPQEYSVVVRFPDSNPFMSGRLIGDRYLHRKPALIEIAFGKGRIIMFGFRPQNRAQPHGTFMLFFNALYYGQAKAQNNPR